MLILTILAAMAAASAVTFVVTSEAKDKEWSQWLDAVNQSWNDATYEPRRD